MKRIFVLVVLSIISTAYAGSIWYKIEVDAQGNAVRKLLCETAFSHAIEQSKNEYPSDYAFPTNDIKYWKKTGNDWVAMTEAEQAVVDSAIQQKALDTATDDQISDAILKCIAESIKQNAKTAAEVRAIFKSQIDPKKKKDKATR